MHSLCAISGTAGMQLCYARGIDAMTRTALLLAFVTGLAGLQNAKPDPARFLTQPLVSHIYTADPSAHVFKGRIYVYP